MTGLAKTRFLVVYDYGMGGIWAFVWASSETAIHDVFRDLKVVDPPPLWLQGEALADIEANMTFDIDNLAPDDWIRLMLRAAG